MSLRRTTGSSGPGALSRPGLLERLGESDPLERLGALSWRRPANFARGSGVVLGSFAAILVGLAVTVALVGGIAAGVTHLTKTSSLVVVKSHGSVTETMTIVTGSLTGVGDQPQYTNPTWSVRVGERVTVKIVSYDDGTAPLMGSQMMYDQVLGSMTGKEMVAGHATSSVADSNVSHTFTVVGLPFNMPIPAAPTGKSVTVEATFVPTKTGTFTWQCYAPCGAGTNGMGGAMSTMKWMEGTIKVTA
ncbi:MAG: hypothetical protein HKL85_09570 [Acidimicrobiaceae bacterium]|nr:hypothetical protein [Acidimicrobiaceae bacterium]